MKDLLARHETILTEGSVYEILRRDPRVRFDEQIAHAALIYDPHARGVLAEVHGRYRDIARAHRLPFLAFTDTWRASGERIARSRFRDRDVNGDNVRFLRELDGDALVGAITGPRGDAYRPFEAPAYGEALRVHAFQIERLAAAGIDLFLAATLPALGEARAIAHLMERTGIASMLSFVVRAEGTLLDGTPLAAAITTIDAASATPPLGYAINCVHPDVARRALATLDDASRSRVIAFQGNTSDLPPEALDDAPEIHTAEPETFAAAITALRTAANLRIVGGCCGTDERHMEAVARSLASAAHRPLW